MLKRVAILLFCLMMIFVATFGFVVGVVSVPTIYSYADDEVADEVPTGYTPVTDDMELAQGFNDYCKSRDARFTSTMPGASYTYIYNKMKEGMKYLGYDIDYLQEGLFAQYNSLGEVSRWYWNTQSIGLANQLFAWLINENDLEVGDVADETVYSGYYFTDDNGTTCLAYKYTPNYTNASGGNVVEQGTPYAFTGNLPITSEYNYTATYLNNSYSIRIYKSGGDNNLSITKNSNNVLNKICYSYYTWNNPPLYRYCVPAIGLNTQDNKIYIGCYWTVYDGVHGDSFDAGTVLNGNEVNSFNIVFTSNGNVINNNYYEGDTIINNEGDVITEPDPVPPGGTDPGWNIGGGGGTATDGNGNTWNIQFPDFELPDLNIDWSINGLGEKFPFSIPFDLVALVTVLNAEPQAPRFEGTVNFGFTTWNYDINLQQFDSVAQACRIAELLLLVVGLILITRSIIKG